MEKYYLKYYHIAFRKVILYAGYIINMCDTTILRGFVHLPGRYNSTMYQINKSFI